MFNQFTALRTYILAHGKPIDHHTVHQALEHYDSITQRLQSWGVADQQAVLNFRIEYDGAQVSILQEMRETGRADHTTAVRSYNMQNHPSPVLEGLNWPIYKEAVYEEGVEKAVPWWEGSTVQGVVHRFMEERELPSTYIDLKPVNNGRGVSTRGTLSSFNSLL
jgi:hypothetical protein